MFAFNNDTFNMFCVMNCVNGNKKVQIFYKKEKNCIESLYKIPQNEYFSCPECPEILSPSLPKSCPHFPEK